MNDVLLINPPMRSPKAQLDLNAVSPPLGLGYLAASLDKAGITVDIVDLNLDRDPVGRFREVLAGVSPLVVGFTSLTQNFPQASFLAGMVKARKKGTKVVMGGPHATYKWQEILSGGTVDAVVRYEGERTLVELVRQWSNSAPDLNAVDGIAFLDGDTPVNTRDIPHEKNLDSFPFPARHFLPMAHYARPGTILTSRGCPRKCIFCISSTYEGHYRTRSADNVVDELAVLRHVWGLKDIVFLDNVFTVDTQRVYDICNQIIGDGLGIRFQCVCRVDLVTRDLVGMLRAAGCTSIEIGVESAEQEVTDAMQKFIRVDEVLEAADIVLGAGLLPLFTFQLGSPFDTAATIDKTRKLAAKLRKMGATTLFSVMTPFPGTPLAERADELGVRIHAKDWYEYRISNPVYDTPHLDRDFIRDAFYQESVAQTD